MTTTPRSRPAKPVQLEPLVPQPAYGRVAAAIEQKILDRSLRPGDPLPTETELASQFGVNRSTVREALGRLESAGLVGRGSGAKRLRVTRPGHAETASRVSRALTLDAVTFIELWEAMLAIAPRTAALAAAHGTTESLQVLEDDIAVVETARGPEAAVAGVVAFFGRLADASGNRVLMLAMQPVTRLLAPSLRRMIDRVPQGRSRIVVAQRCIVEALRKGDAAEAESWMTRHVQGLDKANTSIDTPNIFKWRHFQPEIIVLCMRWYLRYGLSYRDLEEMMAERGLKVDHSAIARWILAYSPELENRVKRQLNATNDSWKVDETYIRVKGMVLSVSGGGS